MNLYWSKIGCGVEITLRREVFQAFEVNPKAKFENILVY